MGTTTKLHSIDDAVLEANKGGQPISYRGKYGSWLIVLSVHRDSDRLTRSNFEVAQQRLGAVSNAYCVERFNHWAVGWVDYLIVDPRDKKLVDCALSMLEDLDQYPVLDESHYSEMEVNEVSGYWNHMSIDERIDAIRYSKSDSSVSDARLNELPYNDDILYEYLANE